jgi:hypothetical protein
MRMRTALLVSALLGVAALSPRPAGAGANGDTEFTREELARLDHGQLVERRVALQRGELRLMGGTSWQVIDAPPEIVWQAVLDTEHYDRMLPQVAEVRLVQEAGDARTVFVRHGGAIVQPSYYLAVKIDRSQHGLTFRMDESRPRSIRAAWGFYTVRPHAGNKTVLVYGVMADIGEGLLHALLRPQVAEWMLKVPSLVKRFVEGRGRFLYKVPAQVAVGPAAPASSVALASD